MPRYCSPHAPCPHSESFQAKLDNNSVNERSIGINLPEDPDLKSLDLATSDYRWIASIGKQHPSLVELVARTDTCAYTNVLWLPCNDKLLRYQIMALIPDVNVKV